MTTTNYETYIKSEQWRFRAAAMRWLAGYRCAICGSQNALEVHHKTYERLGDERPEDLVVLCAECHARFHGKLAAKPGRRELVVTIQAQQRYYELLEMVYVLLVAHPGRDAFSTRVAIDGGEPHPLEYPEITTAITPALVEAVSAIVGAKNAVLENGGDYGTNPR